MLAAPGVASGGMGLRERLQRLDDNPLSEFTYDQATAPVAWWALTACGLLGLGLGVAQHDTTGAVSGAGLTAVGVLLSTLTRRRDRRLDAARRARTEREMDARRARQRSSRRPSR